MQKVDTWFDGNEMYENNGMYYVCYHGIIMSPPFASWKDCTREAWKYMKKTEKPSDEAEDKQ